MVTHSSILPGEFHGQKNLGTTVHGVAKSCTGLSNQHVHFQKCYQSEDFLLLMPKI